MSLQSLPAELVHSICSYCELGSRDLSCVADEYLFTEVVLYMNWYSCDNIRDFVKHPKFAKSVQRLWVQADQMKKLSFDEWEDKVFDSLDNPLKELWGHMEQLADGLRPTTTRENKYFQEGFIDPYDDHSSYYPGVGVLEEIVEAAEKAQYSPKVLRLDYISYGILQSPSREYFVNLLRKVEDMQWHMATPDLRYVPGVDVDELQSIAYDLDNGCFLDVAQHADQLRNLHLKPSLQWPRDVLGYEYDLPQLDAFVEKHIWSCLTSFSISAVETTDEDVADFLLRHSGTLENVLLQGIRLSTSNWPHCFSKLAGRLPRLQLFEVRESFYNGDGGLFYWLGEDGSNFSTSYGKQISQYVRTAGATFPEPPKDQIQL